MINGRASTTKAKNKSADEAVGKAEPLTGLCLYRGKANRNIQDFSKNWSETLG
jgi:hypothetical protein